MANILSDHNGMKLEINYIKKNGNNTKAWKVNNMLLKKITVGGRSKNNRGIGQGDHFFPHKFIKRSVDC